MILSIVLLSGRFSILFSLTFEDNVWTCLQSRWMCLNGGGGMDQLQKSCCVDQKREEAFFPSYVLSQHSRHLE